MESREFAGGVHFSRPAKFITLFMGASLLIWLLLRVQAVLGPFVWAAIIAYIFSPLVNLLEQRTRLRRVWVVVFLYLVGLAVMIWAATVLIPLVSNQVKGLSDEVRQIVNNLLSWLKSQDRDLATKPISMYGFNLDPQVLIDQVVGGLQNLLGYLTSHAIPVVFNVLEVMGQFILSLIVTFYLLRSSHNLRAFVPRLIPRPYRSEALALIRDIDRVLGAYIRGQLLLIGIMILATFIALSILRVRYALTIALISGVLEAIPLFGPLMAGGIAALVALFQTSTPFGWSNTTLALVVVVAYTVLRQIEDQLVVPNLVGPLVDLHPLLVLFALFAGGKLAGFTGLIIAVPAAAALKIIAIYLYRKIWDEQPGEEYVPAPSPAVQPEPPLASGEIS